MELCSAVVKISYETKKCVQETLDSLRLWVEEQSHGRRTFLREFQPSLADLITPEFSVHPKAGPLPVMAARQICPTKIMTQSSRK